MTISSVHGSATIYQFPVGGRAGLNAVHEINQADNRKAVTSPSDHVLTDAWYHQAAIREANQATKQ